MIIGIDGNEANVEKQVGVSVYTRNLLEYFSSVANENTRFQIFLKQPPIETMPKANEWFTYTILPFPFFWLRLFMSVYLFFHRNLSVFFSPAHYTPYYSSCPVVVTIHDLAFYYFPNEYLTKDLYKLTNWTKDAVLKASKVICVSEATQKDVLRHYDIDPVKTKVIYNGFTKHPKEKISTSILNKLKIKKSKFILYVGTLQPRKNIPSLIDAFEKFKTNHPDFKLVLVGKKGWLYEEIFETVRLRNLETDVIFAGYISDEELASLYANALCFVLPSLYEGFGLPILEAMYHKCPVITSFTSSLPEIGSDACLYFDPKKSSELLEKIEAFAESPQLRLEYISKGLRRIQLFSWKECAKNTLQILEESAQNI